MIATRRVRPHRPGFARILAAGLVLSALLAAFPPPAQALPLGGDGGPLAGFLSWFEGLLADFGFSPEASGESDGLEAVHLPEACNMDPSGGTCSKGLTSPGPAVRGGEETLPDRPATR